MSAEQNEKDFTMIMEMIENECFIGFSNNDNKVDLLLRLVNKYGECYHDRIIETINTIYKG
jgi:hypothetical protein